MKEWMAELQTPHGKPVYILPSQVLSIRPHGTKPKEQSWIVAEKGPELNVMGATDVVDAFLRQHVDETSPTTLATGNTQRPGTD